MNQIDSEAPYGTYAVDDRTRLLRMLVGLGLSRGKLTKWIRQRWLDEHGPLVDAEVQGTHYRFDLRDNVTDSKVLLSSKVYDGEEIAALAETVRGGVFIDVGATSATTRWRYCDMVPKGPWRSSRIHPLCKGCDSISRSTGSRTR